MTERISYQEIQPGLLDGILRTGAYLKKSGFPPVLLELVNYRVSQINECPYCLDMHHKEAINMGESELRLHSLAAWRECPFYTDQEKAVFAYAEVLTTPGGQVMDGVFEELQKFYSKQEIALLTVSITHINTWNRINKAFRPVPGNYVVGQL